MNIIDLNYIKEIVTRSDLELLVPKPFTTEEKFLAIETILSSYTELQPRVSELRQKFIDEKFTQSKESPEEDFEDLVDDLNDYIDVINSYTDDEIILMVMEDEWRKREIDDFVEFNRLDRSIQEVTDKVKNGNTSFHLERLSDEIKNTHQKFLLIIKEYHVDRIMCFYIKETLQKIQHPEVDF